jgi:hypothetical protein
MAATQVASPPLLAQLPAKAQPENPAVSTSIAATWHVFLIIAIVHSFIFMSRSDFVSA